MMPFSEAKRLRQFEEEHAIKGNGAELSLDNRIVKGVISQNV